MKKTVLSLVFILGISTISICSDPPPFNNNGPQGIPIDCGASILLGAGAAYGIKKVRNKSQVRLDS